MMKYTIDPYRRSRCYSYWKLFKSMFTTIVNLHLISVLNQVFAENG